MTSLLAQSIATKTMHRRRCISLEQRERLVRAFEDEHEDYLAVADTIGVNRSTAGGIVARYVREGRIADFEGVFVLYFWWGFVQNEDPVQIR